MSYAWPLLPAEEGLQEKVLQMVDDLQLSGVEAFMDITKGEDTTSFLESLSEWIQTSEFVILVGSTSFASRALNPSTSTHLEASEIRKKKRIHSNNIIPVLFEGRFSTSFPPGLQDTIGGRFTSVVEYMKELPGVAATILGVKNDQHIVSMLASYTTEVDSVIDKSKTGSFVQKHEIEEALANEKIIKQYWRSRMLVLLSKFNMEQLRAIDGKVNIRTRKMEEYCVETMKIAGAASLWGIHYSYIIIYSLIYFYLFYYVFFIYLFIFRCAQ